MMRFAGLVVVVVGVVLVIMGIDATESFSSDVSRLLHGTPTDRSIWLMVGGATAMAVGAVMALAPGRRARLA